MIHYLRDIEAIYYLYTFVAGFFKKRRFRNVQSLLIFLGYPRSGSSTLGSLLDAHKNITVAHELNILKYIQKKYKIHQLFFLLDKNSRLFTRKGRISTGYNGIIDGQYNGKTIPCLVIGDKKAGGTSRMLENNIGLENRLWGIFPVIKVIHIVRNPFDMIATEAYKGNEKRLEVTKERLSETINLFAVKFHTIDGLIKQKKFDIFTLRHEELLENPENLMSSILRWLNVPAYEGYIDDCKAHLYQVPHQSRHKVIWSNEQIERVNKLIADYSFLADYSFS